MTPIAIGLVGDDRRDIAALDHVERRRLVEVERHDLGVGVAGRSQRRKHAQRRLGPGDIDAVEIGMLGEHRLSDVLGLAPDRPGPASATIWMSG